MKQFASTSIFVIVILMFSSSWAGESKEGKLVAKYKDVEVTQEDVKRYIAFRVPRDRQAEYLSSEEKMLQVVENIISIRSLAALAESPDEQQLRWQSEFQRQSWLADLAQSQAVQNALAKVDWEAQAREAYIAEPGRHATQANVDAAHILINTRSRSRDEALTLANSLRQRALAGEDFNELAVKYSDDPSVEQNRGELGVFVASRMVKPFADAAFSMKEPGSISEPVETEFGFHLIKLNKATPAGRRSYEQARESIIRGLHSSIAAKAREQLLTETRSLHGVQINKDVIEHFVAGEKAKENE